MDLVLFDLDNTLIAGDSDFEWAQFLIAKGVLDRALYEARNLEFYEQYKAGTLDIEVFLDFQLQPLTRYPREVLDAWLGEFMSRHILPIVGGKARALVRRQQGLATSSPAELRSLIEVLLESCVVTWEGKTARLLPAFDVVMQGRLMTVFKLLAWALEENYADFFGVLKSGLAGLAAKKMEFASMLQSASSPSGPATE
jgi:hypothetical protein